MEQESNPWKIKKSEKVHGTPWISVTAYDVLNPAGNPGHYSTVHFKKYAIGIIPLDEDNNTWMVGQYRFPVNEYSWEIPEGGGDLTIDPLLSAKRELLEETGIKAKKWNKIMEFHLSNAATDELGMVYIAKELSFHPPQPDEDEQLQIKKIPFDQLLEMVMNNDLKDSLTVAGVLKTRLLMDRGMI